MTERRAIGTFFYDMDKEITVLEDRVDKNSAIRQGTMQQLLTRNWRPGDAKERRGSIRNAARGHRDSARLATQVTEETTQRTARKPPENSPIQEKTARKQPETVDCQPTHHQKSDTSGETPPETARLPDQILSLLSLKPSAGRREIAAALDSTESKIRYHIDKLRAAGRIERVGPDKGGHWKVLDDSGANSHNH